MLKSLYAGISGLQAHQVAMDVESNNIANVNTVGFKYSRANFSDMLAQTKQIATSPEGNIGGKNAVQVGLGSNINSTTRIHSQGSIQATDKTTDVAIQGDGFFIVSSDGGRTTNYTRSGDFKFDASGNFVDNGGLVVQGWLRDDTIKKVDSSGPITSINIDPGLTTPAEATSEVTLKANLNSSNTVENFSVMNSTDNMDVMFDENGNAFNLGEGSGVAITFSNGVAAGTPIELQYTDTLVPTVAGQFHTTEQLRAILETQAQAISPGSTVSITDGKFIIDNSAGTGTLKMEVAEGADNNARFKIAMDSISGTLVAGSTGVRQSQEFNAAVHSSSIDVFDSLGSKHTVKIDFRKTEASVWTTEISVPEPAQIDTDSLGNPLNTVAGQIEFTEDGGLRDYQPRSLTFTGNNGSAPNQDINLNFGDSLKFNGITSYDATSTTSGISQDGYTGGDLLGIRVDQTGTLVGSFTNGRSFGLAQIAMAKFANNEGLSVNGGNIYNQTANSGEPVVGEAATGGRGFIQSSSLESSNADLSRSLTQLIIVQRGYQANGKTITTSDQLLQALLALKN